MSDEEEKKEGEPTPEPTPQWERRPLKVNQHLQEVIELASKATTLQLNALRKRLHKLQYGGR